MNHERVAGLESTVTPILPLLLVEDPGAVHWDAPWEPRLHRLHAELEWLATKWRLYRPGKSVTCQLEAARIERAHARPLRMRAIGAVILAIGGFIANRELWRANAPHTAASFPISGTGATAVGCASGAGRAAAAVENISCWLFITPPSA